MESWWPKGGATQIGCMHTCEIDLRVTLGEGGRKCGVGLVALGQEIDKGYANQLWGVMAAPGGWW